MNKGFSWRSLWLLWTLCLPLLLVGNSRAAEVIPPVPARYFNDYALTVKPETADRLNRELEDYERQSSNQLRVAVYPKMQSESDIADYCQRVARSWKVGEQDKRNGAILFVFAQDHKMNIQVGYGLEGKLTDAACKDIIADQIAPKFKANDYDGGLTAGVGSMIAATKGEYQGSGKTEYERQHPGGQTGRNGGGIGVGTIFFLIIAFFVVSSLFNRRRGGPGGTMFGGGMPIFIPGGFGGGFSGGSRGDSGGGGSSDGGGFASSGGGDFGGGGASGDW